jgi:exodeoxyribonuclease VII small subunit
MATKKDMTLEERLKRLEEIATMLDRGDKPLQEQLTAFEEGMKLAQTCREELQKAELKIEQLTKA